jgi:hypothetical protein
VITTSNGIFMVSISAAEGENTLVLWAVDGAGNERTLELEFTVDSAVPELVLTAPEADPELVTTARYTISGTVWDGEVATATTLLLDGLPYSTVDDGTGGQERVDLVISTEDGTFEIPVDLADGMNEMTVTVVDGAGNSASLTVHLVLDTKAPLLTVAVEPSRTTEEGIVETWDRNLHLSGSTDPGATLTLNDVPVVVGENGTYDAYFRLPSEGSGMLTLTSTDQAGNVRQVELEVSYKVSEDEAEEGGPWTLVGGLVVLVVLVLIAVFYVISRSSGAGQEAIEPDEGVGEELEEEVEYEEIVEEEVEEEEDVEAEEEDEWEEDEEKEPDELEELLDDLEDEKGGER